MEFPLPACPGPRCRSPPTRVTLIGDSVVPGDRVIFSVVSGVGAEMMMFLWGEDGPRLIAVNGKEVSGGMRYLEHWGTRDGGVVLEFTRPAPGEVLRFAVVEHLLRPEELVGEGIFARPPELAPNIKLFSDLAVIRTPVTVDPLAGTVEAAGAGATA